MEVNRGADLLLFLATDFISLPDDEYLEDPRVGARIGSAAIRRGMQAVLDTGKGCLHVHAHPHRGLPQFSRVDLEETPPIVKSLRAVDRDSAHGMLLLSSDALNARLWLPGKEEPDPAGKIVVVGRPMEFFYVEDTDGSHR